MVAQTTDTKKFRVTDREVGSDIRKKNPQNDRSKRYTLPGTMAAVIKRQSWSQAYPSPPQSAPNSTRGSRVMHSESVSRFRKKGNHRSHDHLSVLDAARRSGCITGTDYYSHLFKCHTSLLISSFTEKIGCLRTTSWSKQDGSVWRESCRICPLFHGSP